MKLKIYQDWLNELFSKETWPILSSTLISGPGGSGKPLIGFAFVYDWLKAGGNVIFIPLQYPNTEFVKTSLKKLYNLNVEDYSKNIFYVQFDYNINTTKKIDKNLIKANLLKPKTWKDVVNKGEEFFSDNSNDKNEKPKSNTLVFASALNLLLFSPSYKKVNLDNIEEILKYDKKRSYLFSVSTSAFSEDIKRWEGVADNLMFAKMKKDMELFLSLDRLKNKDVPYKEVRVPIKKEILKEIKKIAEDTRNRKIPELIKI